MRVARPRWPREQRGGRGGIAAWHSRDKNGCRSVVGRWDVVYVVRMTHTPRVSCSFRRPGAGSAATPALVVGLARVATRAKRRKGGRSLALTQQKRW